MIEIPKVLKLFGKETQKFPLVFDSPHSGTNYPNDFRAYVRKPANKMVANGAVEMRHLTQYLRNKLEAAR